MPPKPEKPKEAGFRIAGGLFFPIIQNEKWKQGDVPLIEAVTRKDFAAWIRLLNKHGLSHALTKLGYLAVAIQRVNDATVEEVVEFIHDLPLLDGITLEFPEDAKPKEGEEGPTKVEGDETED